MRTSAARVLREDDQGDMSREAVLLQWERKIEAAERRPGRFEREEATGEGATVEELRPARERRDGEGPAAPPTEDSTHEGAQRFDAGPGSGRVGRTRSRSPASRRRPAGVARWSPPRIAQPDTLALWAFLLGLFLVVRGRRDRARLASRADAPGRLVLRSLEWISCLFLSTLTPGKSHAEREAP